MSKPSFATDYEEGAHPAILKRLVETNLEQSVGYGLDPVSESARDRIRTACACPQAAVHFLIGGTQVNTTMLDALLASYEGVVAADTAHVALHEAGAIEAGGHKVLTLPGTNGKITSEQVDEFCSIAEADGSRDHMVFPGVVYLSQPTEYGTLYSLDELERMRTVCDRHSLRLYIDGARLAYALASPANDVTLPDLARLCDAFYIGGTKCGALLGEAVVVPDPNLIPHLFTIIKQHGALLAKGRLLGIQFDELFRDDLYLRIGKPALKAADALRALFKQVGLKLAFDSPTNQTFVVLENQQMERLAKLVEFDFWERADATHTVVRFATSWATRMEAVEALRQELLG